MADWDYEKYDEKGEKIWLPTNDFDGKITGKVVMNIKAYFDENPKERIRLGWIKHIRHTLNEVDYDPQIQYTVCGIKPIDAYTVEDVYYVMNKSEEQLELEELLDYKIDTIAVGNGIRFM